MSTESEHTPGSSPPPPPEEDLVVVPFSNYFWGLLAVGALCCVLGMGNMLIGTERSARYMNLIQSAEQESLNRSEQLLLDQLSASNESSSTEEEDLMTPPTPSGLLTEEEQSRLLSMRHRLEYYRFCIVGGKYLLALGGCLLLAALVVARLPIGNGGDQQNLGRTP